MRRVARLLSIGGGAVAVLALSKVHARFIALPHYDFTGSSRFGWAAGYIAFLAVAAYALGLPDQPRNRRDAGIVGFSAALLAGLGVSALQLLVGDALLPRFVVFGTILGMIPIQVTANAIARRGNTRAEDRDRVLLVAAASEHVRLLDDLGNHPERAASLVGTLTCDQAAGIPGRSPLVDRQRETDATVLVLDRHAQADDRVIAQAALLHESGVRVRTLQGFYEGWLGKLPLSELERNSLLFDIGEVHRTTYGRVKRLSDIAIGLLGCVVLVLAIPVVLVGDRLGNPGPLLYRQTRVGKGGVPFTILKFRSMTGGDGTSDGRSEWTTDDDPRVTPFGRFLRRTHLDELPQVVNIVRGDLAVVGPRPEQPQYVAELSDKLAFYDLRHLVRPGLTGWAQVKYGYAGDERDALEKLQYEFFYLRNQDVRFDLRVIVRTVRSIVGGAGAGR
jgi:lipopolysaccharide/colanic/teichoic acid biosynthesis glycosyltransferase